MSLTPFSRKNASFASLRLLFSPDFVLIDIIVMLLASAFRSVLRWIGFASIALASPLGWAQSTSSLAADGFDPNVNGNVYAVAVQPDGKILIAGSFSELRPNGATSATGRNNIARLLASGLVDASFNATVNGQISAMVLQPNGQIVIGGKFTTVGNATRNRVARLNTDGSLDATFDPNVGGGLTPEVTSLVLQSDQKIVVGGGFTTVQSNGASAATTRNRIARFNADGSLDAAFNPNANGLVLSLAVQTDGKILVGGGFTSLQPTGATEAIVRNRIARLNTDGSVDTSFTATSNNSVNAIAILANGRILIGGTFTSVSGVTVNRLARLELDGSVVSTGFLGGADGQVYVIVPMPDGTIMVGGSFANAGGGAQPYLARLLPGGTIDGSFSAGPNFNVYAVAAQSDGSVVLGGGFTTLRGSGVTSTARNHVARVSSTGALDADFRPDANGRLRAVAVQGDGKLLVGGSFTSVGGVTHSGIVRLNANGTVDPSFNAVVSGTVLAVVYQGDGRVVIGGTFTRVNGVARFNLARLNSDGSTDTTYDPATNNTVNSLALLPDGKILAGGIFTLVRPNGTTEPVTVSNVARINTDGSLDVPYKLRTNGGVQAITVQPDGKVLIGGDFTAISADDVSSVQRSGIARLNADGKVDTGFNPNVDGMVMSILVQADKKIVFGGSFTQMSPAGAGVVTARSNIARVNEDGSLDTTFDPSANGVVLALAQTSDNKILAGGFFTGFRPNGVDASKAVARRYIARLNADGTVDTDFDLQLDETPGNVVSSIVKTTSPGGMLIGGAFNSVSQQRRSRIARLTDTGAIDGSFNADFNTANGPVVQSLTTELDGRVLAAGEFAAFNGSQSVNLTRFNRDGFSDTTFTPSINGPVYATAQLPTKGAVVATQRPGMAWLQSNGQLRSGTFASEPTMTSVISIVVQPNGQLLLAGNNGSSGSLVRFNADGTADTAFKPAVNGAIYTVRLLADNKILIGGEFTSVATVTRNNIARLNSDGTLDTAFNLNANGPVLTTAVQGDGKIIIGGSFTGLTPASGTTTNRNRIARLNADGTIEAEFNPNVNESVRSVLILEDGKILIGGVFTLLQPNGATTATSRTYLARLNAAGTVDEAFDMKVDAVVATLVLQPADKKILVGGFFSHFGTVQRNYLGRLNADGTLDAGFNPNPNDAVQTISVDSTGKILIGGFFRALDPGNTVHNPATSTPRNQAARLNADGTIDASFNPGFNSAVTTLLPLPDGTILAGGSFTAIQPSGSLLVGGAFNLINGLAVNNLALFGRDGSISSTFLPSPNGAVYALAPQINGQVVVGGAFTSVKPSGTTTEVTRNHIARFKADDTLDAAFNPNANGDVFAIVAQPDGKLLVGGSFTTIGGAGRANLARLNTDGSNDSSFNPSVTGAVRTIALQASGSILVTQEKSGGNELVRLTSSGALDNSFTAANNGSVSSVAVQTDGHIMVGGSFTSIGGGNRNYLARLNASGSLDSSFTAVPNGAVTALSIQEDGKVLIGGVFNEFDGLPRFGLARVPAPVAAVSTFSSDTGHTSVTWSRSGGAPEVQGVVFERSSDAISWTTLGEAARIAGTTDWKLSGLSLGSGTTVYVRARAIVPASPGGSTGVIGSQVQFHFGSVPSVPAVPVITSATVVNGASGSAFSYAITASGIPTSFSASGLPAGLTINPTTGIISGTPTAQGTFNAIITATNSLGSASATLKIFVGPPGSVVDTGRLVNLSVLAPVNSASPIIAGFVVTGSGTQDILLRAVGPGLSDLGVTNGLANPNLHVFNSAGAKIHHATSWGGDSALSQQFVRLGAFPLNPTSADAALLLTLTPGRYTVHVTDPGTTGGAALAEIYDASITPTPSNAPHLVNLSARGVVGTAGHQVTGGFVITGATPKRVLIRGIGPGLAPLGVSSVLADPVVSLNKIGTGAGVIARNDNWSTPTTVDATFPAATAAEIEAAAKITGAFELAAGSADAAILVTLAPGVYTAQVGSATTTTGAAMVEVYEVP